MTTPNPNPAPQENQNQPEFLSGKILDGQDILQLLHISKRTLLQWRKKGTLPYSKVGNKIYYRAADVEAMLQKARRVGRG